MRNLITDVRGVLVGQAHDAAAATGVTAAVFERPAVASAAVLGGGPGTRDTDLLQPEMTVEHIDAVVLAGGSAWGLGAADGVMGWLASQGRGFPVGSFRVPIVPQAILMDLLNGGNKDWGLHSPYRDLGYAAFEAASGGPFAIGTVGAGTGATTANLKGGLGSASARTSRGAVIAAIAAVNAMGSAVVGDGPHFWAAPFEQDGEFGGLGLPSSFHTAMRIKGMTTTATTIAAIVTDAALTKAEAHRLSIAAHDGLARALSCAHLPLDGDTVFAASTARQPLAGPEEFMELCHIAGQVMARAIARGVYEVTALPYAGALPAWRDQFADLRP